jgi:predicted metalloprotease with PDZ domain
MEGPHTGPVVVAYRVDLSFVREAWPAGNEQAGFFDGDALYLVTKALFIADDAPGERRVTFDLPEGWKATTPWPRASGDSWTFLVADRTDLLRNSFVVGRHVEIRFEDGPLTLSLALPGSIAKAAATIEPALRRVVRAYGRLFDRTPRGRYLMTVFYAPQDNGEAFLHSSAFTRMSREWRASSPATISRGFSPAT